MHAVAYLGFCEGGQSQRREIRGAGGANGVGCPLPTEDGVWGGGCAPSPEFLKKFSGSLCSKNVCVQAKGEGASPSAPPPKYATACMYDKQGLQ